jgi:acetoin utilization deacetylase AcuC-like enzyme
MTTTTVRPIPVFYTQKMVADSRSLSPSAAKPEKVVASWGSQFPIEIIEPTPVTVDELVMAHDRSFVEGVLSLKIENGFGNKSPQVATSLVYTSGAMLSAARHAIKTNGVAVAPVSGFHHAGFFTAQGFCTFNGLMVTALALQAQGVQKIAILDLDMHYGNGTDDIIRRLHVPYVKHFTGGAVYFDKSQVPDFFNELPKILAWMSDYDVVLYQAGADSHINDPHGGFLTTEELRVRDAVIFDAFKAAGVPVAWNLAGGYQIERDGSIPKVLEIHDNTMRECVRVYGAP